MNERYKLGAKDEETLEAAASLLKKVASAGTTRPAQLVSVAKVLHVLSVLPRVTPEVTAFVSVSSPRRKFGDIETYHWWTVEVEEGRRLRIWSGGHYYQRSTGGDTFTTMSWRANTEEPAEMDDYREALWMVPGVPSFSEGVESIDLASEGYSIEIVDHDNGLLDLGRDEDIEDADAEVDADEASEGD
jgi:hypothetical protein